MATRMAEVTWVRHLLDDTGEKLKGSLLMCDNQNTVNIAHNPIQHGRTKPLKQTFL